MTRHACPPYQQRCHPQYTARACRAAGASARPPRRARGCRRQGANSAPDPAPRSDPDPDPDPAQPTNDLDLGSVESLEALLADFAGCVLTVSHDRAFMAGAAARLFVLRGDGVVRLFEGSYDEVRGACGGLLVAAALRSPLACAWHIGKQGRKGPARVSSGCAVLHVPCPAHPGAQHILSAGRPARAQVQRQARATCRRGRHCVQPGRPSPAPPSAGARSARPMRRGLKQGRRCYPVQRILFTAPYPTLQCPAQLEARPPARRGALQYLELAEDEERAAAAAAAAAADEQRRQSRAARAASAAAEPRSSAAAPAKRGGGGGGGNGRSGKLRLGFR